MTYVILTEYISRFICKADVTNKGSCDSNKGSSAGKLLQYMAVKKYMEVYGK